MNAAGHRYQPAPGTGMSDDERKAKIERLRKLADDTDWANPGALYGGIKPGDQYRREACALEAEATVPFIFCAVPKVKVTVYGSQAAHDALKQWYELTFNESLYGGGGSSCGRVQLTYDIEPSNASKVLDWLCAHGAGEVLNSTAICEALLTEKSSPR
jgi:hypothetical protein